MKRSEMIGLLSDALLQFMNVEKRKRDLIADVILSETERSGMLPPTVDQVAYTHEGDTEGITFPVNEWESE